MRSILPALHVPALLERDSFRLGSQGVRVGDVIGRWGGEEFMLLLPGSDPADALGAAERLRAGIEAQDFEPVERVTASFGVVVLAPAEGFDALVKRADVALYRAKSAGRNRVETVSGD